MDIHQVFYFLLFLKLSAQSSDCIFSLVEARTSPHQRIDFIFLSLSGWRRLMSCHTNVMFSRTCSLVLRALSTVTFARVLKVNVRGLRSGAWGQVHYYTSVHWLLFGQTLYHVTCCLPPLPSPVVCYQSPYHASQVSCNKWRHMGVGMQGY